MEVGVKGRQSHLKGRRRRVCWVGDEAGFTDYSVQRPPASYSLQHPWDHQGIVVGLGQVEGY